MDDSMLGSRARQAVGAVAAAGVALGGLAVIAPDADAQAYGQTCNLVLNTDAPADPHWGAQVIAQMSSSMVFDIPVYTPPDALGGGAVSAPYIPMSSGSMPAAAVAGKVICIIGNHPAVVNGTAGGDTIYGGAGNETINGLGGNDVIFGNGGDDVLIGKAGNDSLNGGSGNDILFGHAGQNTATPQPRTATNGGDDGGNDTLNGGDGNDLLRGDFGNDLLNGNNGDDCLLGGKHDDEIYGWNDDDTIGGGSGADYLAGNDNNDHIFGGKGNDTIRGNDGLDQIWGDSDLFDEGHEMTLGVNMSSLISSTIANPLSVPIRWGRIQPHLRYRLAIPGAPGIPAASTANVPVSTVTTTGVSGLLSVPSLPPPIVGLITDGVIDQMTILAGATTMIAFHALTTTVSMLGGALTASNPLAGPIIHRGNKVDYWNSSNVGGLSAEIVTVSRQAWIAGLTEGSPLLGAHATSSGMTIDDQFISHPNLFLLGATFTNVPHVRHAHLEEAACNLDQARIMDDAFQVENIGVTGPWATPNSPFFGILGPPVFSMPVAPLQPFSGVTILGLGTIHMSMVAMSSVGDVEIPMLTTITVAGAQQYGPSGAFLQWPGGWDNSNGYNDDIRGGDSDDRLFGEAGHDTIWGDHGDDTIFGEGNAAAWELNEAAFNVAATNLMTVSGGVIPAAGMTIGGVPTVPWSNFKRKLPIGLEPQYTGAAGGDSLSGNIDDDNIDGGPGADHLLGGPDDDHLVGGPGSPDRLDGGEHWDGCSPQGGFVNDCEVLV